MRKLRYCVALASMGFAAMASADQLNLSVLVNGGATATASNGEVLTVSIMGTVDADGAGGAAADQGLALWGSNADAVVTSGDGMVFDLTDQAQFLVSAPAGMANFDRNLGLTNPPGPPAMVTGYSGTASGSTLLQIGGGQNTIGNVDPPAYPVGPVSTGIANNVSTVLASGTMTAPATGTGDITLTLSACFANTLASAGPAPFPVNSAVCNVVGSATVTVSAGLPLCNATDVNCDGSTSAGDLGLVQAAANWLMPTGSAANPRADVNGDGTVSAGDLGLIQAAANWLSSTGPCTGPGCP